MILVIFNYLY